MLNMEHFNMKKTARHFTTDDYITNDDDYITNDDDDITSDDDEMRLYI